jgi:excisionase family DNA binding protein
MLTYAKRLLGGYFMPVETQTDYYNVSEAARFLHVSPSTVWRWIAAEKLPAYRVGVRTVRIKKEDLERIMAPVRGKEVHVERAKVLGEPPSAAELARRQKVVAQILANREKRSIAPLTSADLIHQVREEREERYRSWFEQPRK